MIDTKTCYKLVMPEKRKKHQKKKLLNVAQNIEVEKVEARWGIPSWIVDDPQYTKIHYYFEVREVHTVRPTRRRETETGGTEYYKKITSFIRGPCGDDGARVMSYMKNMIRQEQYRELETLLNHVYAFEMGKGPYPFAMFRQKRIKKKNETDSDVEEITTEKLAEKKQPQKRIWHSASEDGILAWANGKQGRVTAVKEEEGMRYGTDETHGEPFQVLQAHDPFDPFDRFDEMRVVIDTAD